MNTGIMGELRMEGPSTWKNRWMLMEKFGLGFEERVGVHMVDGVDDLSRHRDLDIYLCIMLRPTGACRIEGRAGRWLGKDEG